jgi:hypothetical protein
VYPGNAKEEDGVLVYEKGIRLSENLQQGRSYFVSAVAEDMNKPLPNRGSAFCSTPLDEPLICTLMDPPCIQSLDISCECIGSGHAQVKVQMGKKNTTVEEGYVLQYVILEAFLPGEATRINTTAYPLPTVAQVREGTKPVAASRLVASGFTCVGNAEETIFTIPDPSSATNLEPGRDYVICAVPPAVSNYTCGEPTCSYFSTFKSEVPFSCTMSACSCNDEEQCRTILRCNTPQPTLIKYRVGPSDCGGLPSMTCQELFSCSLNSCCPVMSDPFNQASACCPAIAEGVLCVNGTVNHEIAGMASCGEVDVLVCGARSFAEKCTESGCTATEVCSPSSEHSLEDEEARRQERCKPQPLSWLEDGAGQCIRPLAGAASIAPSAADYSDPTLFANVKCGQDNFAPSLCEVSVCQPSLNTTCARVPGTEGTVHVLADSSGTVCCMTLPYTARAPSVVDVMEGNLPQDDNKARLACTNVANAREWSTVTFPQIDHNEMYMVR